MWGGPHWSDGNLSCLRYRFEIVCSLSSKYTSAGVSHHEWDRTLLTHFLCVLGSLETHNGLKSPPCLPSLLFQRQKFRRSLSFKNASKGLNFPELHPLQWKDGESNNLTKYVLCRVVISSIIDKASKMCNQYNSKIQTWSVFAKNLKEIVVTLAEPDLKRNLVM